MTREKLIETVRITAADCNFGAPVGRWFDGLPFDPMPEWLNDAWHNKTLIPHRYGHTDYAQWLIVESDGKRINLGPGDKVRRLADGTLKAEPTQARYADDTDWVVSMLTDDGFIAASPYVQKDTTHESD